MKQNKKKYYKDKQNLTSSILHVSNSRSKSNKHVKRGLKGKDCKYFNRVKLSCDNAMSGYYKQFCKPCNLFDSINKKELSPYEEDYIEKPVQSFTHEKTKERTGNMRANCLQNG